MEPIINIQGLGKKYRIGKGNAQPYLSLRDAITRSFKNTFSKKDRPAFWSLQDINLQIAPGERIGIIGRNGAGKSTLLKILSRITPPTKGSVTIYGKVASLLEVGTGFHPELTGRENIYLNGSILGLKKKEIERQLEEIIDFSGVEQFIDTPLKHYSSGMQLRLAFSVAAHLEPEILLIDEVLAVGDMEFQKKCIGKMKEVSQKDGRTIVFVSHNLGFVQNFCSKTVLLDKGRLLEFDETARVISHYINHIQQKETSLDAVGNKSVQVEAFRIYNTAKAATDQLLLGCPAIFSIQLKAHEKRNHLEIAFNIKNEQRELISHITSLDKQLHLRMDKGDTLTADIQLESVNYTPGDYTVDIFVLNNDEMCWGCEDGAQFSVLNSEKALRMNGFPSHVKVFTATEWQLSHYGDL